LSGENGEGVAAGGANVPRVKPFENVTFSSAVETLKM